MFLNCGFDVTRGQNRGMWCSCCCYPEKNREWPGVLLQLSVSGNWALTKISLLKIIRTVVSHYTPIPEKTGSCMEVRPNSPRGKFEITYMADDQVDLTPEDISGACFSEKEKGKLTVAQLKF